MAELPLISRMGETIGYGIVDDADADWLGQWTWRASGDKGGSYVVRGVGGRGGPTIRMHRLIMGLEDGDPMEVDHINLNRLDNRRSNLRTGTHALNHQNKVAVGGSSRFRGVSFHPPCRKWRATVGLDGRQVYLGVHASEIDAARAAEAFRLEHMPFALPDPALAELMAA